MMCCYRAEQVVRPAPAGNAAPCVVGYVFMCETSCESPRIIVFRAEDEAVC